MTYLEIQEEILDLGRNLMNIIPTITNSIKMIPKMSTIIPMYMNTSNITTTLNGWH